VPKILIVGGGYAGFYTALKLEKWLRNGEAEVTVVDPLPYMTYQPFLPEVAAGSIEPRHAVVALRPHLKSTRVVAAKVTGINHATKSVTITPADGEPWDEDYDIIVVTAGSVSRTFPIPGVADEAIGLKTIEEATAIRDRLLDNFERASTLPAGPERDRLLTTVVVGGGFAGIEIFGELRSFASSLLKYYPQLTLDDTHFHLIEAMGRIMPEVSLKTSHWVLKNLAEHDAIVHLETQLTSAVDGKIELSTGETFESDLIVWTAGVMASPMLRNTDLPIEERGRLRVQADLRVINDDGVVPDAWGAGDVSAVPDITGCSERPARRAPGQAARQEHRCDASRREPGRVLPQERGSGREHRSRHRRVPVGQSRGQGPPGLVHAPRLPRAGDPDMGAQDPRLRELVPELRARSRHCGNHRSQRTACGI
jgi:NADH dehydrogenase